MFDVEGISLSFSELSNLAVALGTFGLAAVSYWQGQQLRRQYKAERAAELAENIYTKLLRDIDGWLNKPAGRFGEGSLDLRVEDEHYPWLWGGMKTHYPHLIRKTPPGLRKTLDEAEPLFRSLRKQWPKLHRQLEDTAEVLINQDLLGREGRKDRFDLEVQDEAGRMVPIPLEDVWVQEESLADYVQRRIPNPPKKGEENFRFRVAGEVEELGEPQEVVDQVFESFGSPGWAEKLRDEYRTLERLGQKAQTLIESELDEQWL